MTKRTETQHDDIARVHYEKCTAKIADFMEYSPETDTISNHTKCVIANFLDETKFLVNAKFQHDGVLNQIDLINIHIAALRDCVLDLSKAKDFITKGVKQ